MIAAQLLAYYFTELKDDQLKKVSESATRSHDGCNRGGSTRVSLRGTAARDVDQRVFPERSVARGGEADRWLRGGSVGRGGSGGALLVLYGPRKRHACLCVGGEIMSASL